MNLTLRQLSLFDSICRLSSLGAAADEQAISQSAASQSLKELERQLGFSLFRKSGRSLKLTELGEQALPKVRDVLATLESLKYTQTDFIGGTLRVCASETIASYLMPQLLADFVTRFPQAEPVMTIQNTEGVVRALANGQASVGFIEGPVKEPAMQVTSWREDRLVAFCSPRSAWSELQINNSNVAKLPWIVREPGSGTRAVFDRGFALLQQTPRILMALNRQEAIKQSARAGLGVGCLSALSVADELANGVLVPLDHTIDFSRRFSIVQLKSDSTTPLVKAFAEFSMSWQTPNR